MGEKDMYLSKCRITKKAYYLSYSWEIMFDILSTSLLQSKENPSRYITITASFQ